MTNFFLRAKHWQLFLIYLGLPFVIMAIAMSMIFSSFPIGPEPPTMEMFENIFNGYLLMLGGPMLLIALWYYSVGMGLQKFVPRDVEMKRSLFTITAFFPLVYILLMVFTLKGIVMEVFSMVEMEMKNPSHLTPFEIANIIKGKLYLFPLFILGQLMTMFSMFHNFYFVAKTIKTCEAQKKVGFGDFIGEFFLAWFMFIGVWILQPRINKIEAGEFEGKTSGEALDEIV